MGIKGFIEKFIEQFDDEPTCEVAAETVFRDIDGWTFIVALSVMSMIDEEYDVQLNASEIRKTNTLQESFYIVASRQ